MIGTAGQAVNLLDKDCPGLFEDLPHWFQSLSDDELGRVWVSAVTAMVTEYAPDVDARSLAFSLLEVKSRLFVSAKP